MSNPLQDAADQFLIQLQIERAISAEMYASRARNWYSVPHDVLIAQGHRIAALERIIADLPSPSIPSPEEIVRHLSPEEAEAFKAMMDKAKVKIETVAAPTVHSIESRIIPCSRTVGCRAAVHHILCPDSTIDIRFAPKGAS